MSESPPPSAAQEKSPPFSAAARSPKSVLVSPRQLNPAASTMSESPPPSAAQEKSPRFSAAATTNQKREKGKEKMAGEQAGDGSKTEVGVEVSSSSSTAKKMRKNAKMQEKPQESAVVNLVHLDPSGSFSSNYGDLPMEVFQTLPALRRSWTDVCELVPEAEGRTVLIRGWAQAIRPLGRNLTFLVLRHGLATVQCVLVCGKSSGVSNEMARYVRSLPNESFIEVEGVVSLPPKPLSGTTQEVELSVSKLYCINTSVNQLPFNLDDAARTCEELKKAEERGDKLPHVSLDIRLNNRILDLRTPANQAIFKMKSEVEFTFIKLLHSMGFLSIGTPKLTPGISEGGSAVFRLNYVNGQDASLAQSPQLYKQMAINGGLKQVFEVGTVFRAEKSNTHRHLCEYTGMHVEMEIKEHYFEVCDLLGTLLVTIFDHLSETCGKELDIINEKYPSEPLKYQKETLKLKYSEGIAMLKDSGFAIENFDDLNSQAEKKLGQLVRERFDTDFYILYEYPLILRPFYTMPCAENREYSNSFDAFIRGEEVVSGSQRIHKYDVLLRRIVECGIDHLTLEAFTDSFRCGAPPRGGFGAGLERVVMLYCGLPNIRLASLFPRDPQRLTP